MINLYSVRPKGFNIGNDAIYIALKYFIRSAFKDDLNVISLPATGKYESHRKAGINSSTVYEINQFGHGVILGGGNLYENGELEINEIALKALERPLMIYSLSRGKVYNKKLKLVDRTDVMTDHNIRLLNEAACVSLSRDLATTKHIENLGCQSITGGCPTLFMNEIPQHPVPISKNEKTDALISIRTPSLMSIPISYQYDLRNQLIEIINILKSKGYKQIKILCHDHRDIPFASSFYDYNIEYLYTEDIYTYLTWLKNTKLNVTFRLHSFIPCSSYKIPSINISYDQRAQSMIETIKMDTWDINLLKDNLIEEFKNRISNLGDFENLVEKCKKDHWLTLKNIMEDGCKKFAKSVYEGIHK